jgi:hypothetical protein
VNFINNNKPPEGITFDQKANTRQKKFKHARRQNTTARRPIVTRDKETPPTKSEKPDLKAATKGKL